MKKLTLVFPNFYIVHVEQAPKSRQIAFSAVYDAAKNGSNVIYESLRS